MRAGNYFAPNSVAIIDEERPGVSGPMVMRWAAVSVGIKGPGPRSGIVGMAQLRDPPKNQGYVLPAGVFFVFNTSSAQRGSRPLTQAIRE
jgi:hypothetical protein